jgi:type I restriction enzyme S subunit
MVKLGTLVTIKTGRLDANAAEDTGIYPFFTCSRESLKINSYAFDCDAILIAGNGDLNVKHYNGKFNAYQRTYVITTNSNDILNTRYLFYFMDKYIERLRVLSIGGVIKYIKIGMLTDVEIPLPCLTEQKRIAAILDKAYGILQKRDQSIKLADDFLRATFLNMFGTPEHNIHHFPKGIIRDLVDSVNYGSSAKASVDSGEYPVLRMGNITYKGGWDFTELKYLDLSEKEKHKFLVKEGDLLFNRTNSKELVGKTAVYEEARPMAFAGYLIRIRSNPIGNNYYISGYLNSTHGKITLMNMCKSIVGMANINAQELQNIEILIPPKHLQDKYENTYKRVKMGLAITDRSAKQLRLLVATFANKYFM